ncbi:hypothetical protein vseg_018856 [Gypsophila vaccaria]
MHHVSATIEEQLILKAIREECSWENLPKRLQSTVSSKEEWHRRVIEHCIKKRLQWNTCFSRKLIKESEYYDEMMRYLRRNLALFPYHLAEYVCRVMRISPFRYYCDIIFEVMKNEQPYDSIPNFSAADALRITGVGRNEFIDIMNKCRSKKFMWKINKSIAKELLPTQPVDIPIEPWWGVCLVNFTLEEFKKLSEEEMATIDKICKEEANSYVLFDPQIIRGLHRRGLIYFDVPVYQDDRFKVSRLEGFVSNREQSYEDPIEELLYAVFVVSSENATVAELAATLQADLLQLQCAASFACRLGWAEKIIDPSFVLQDASLLGSLALSDDDDASRASVGSTNVSVDGASSQPDSSISDSRGASNTARVAFIVDANITSYLMMGSVSPGLKSHAVTLYEAGKLGHASIADLCKDLGTLEGAKFEGELQEFANHASSLRCVLECLLSGGVSASSVDVDQKVDTLSSQNTDAFKSVDTSFPVNGNIVDHDGESSTTIESQNEGASIDSLVSDSPSNLTSTAGSLDTTIIKEEHADIEASAVSSDKIHHSNDDKSKLDPILEDAEKTIVSSAAPKKKRNYRVDVLRCESLASLPSATLDRLFHRDYDIVLSMVPLPPSSMLPGPTGPVHFGPPSHSSMTPWMKLALYSAVGSGPLSVVLMKGQYLRLLPAPLAGCEKALIWSWDGATVGGLGGKFEGSLVKGTVLLHCLNSLLKHSAILVQPLSKNDLDGSGKVITIDIPLPLKNSDGSLVHLENELGLDVEESMRLESLLRDIVDRIDLWTIGYIRLLRLFVEQSPDQFSNDSDKYEWVPLGVEFGVPLFSPKLCKSMCRRIISSQLLQTESFNEHHEAMHGLRRRLRNVCTDFSTTGPIAKLLYQKEKTRDTSRQLMTYASGRWNPLVEPSSPISGPSGDHQRKKLALRQRSRREVLSFDGSILRSYALTPVYEAATRPVDEPLPSNVPKGEFEEGESKEVNLPAVSLLFDGAELEPFEIGACLQARQPISLITEAASVTSSMVPK